MNLSLLGGGITNLTFRGDVGGESFVLRIAGADTEMLGISDYGDKHFERMSLNLKDSRWSRWLKEAQ